MSAEVAGIAFELSFDGSKMMTSINSSCKKIKDSFTKSFFEAGKSAKTAVETSNSEIQAILDDTARSAKSKAAAIAAIYKKEGDSMSDAMSKAWSHIERESKNGAKSTKRDMKGMSKQSQKTADEIKSNLSNSFASVAKKAAAAFASAFAVKKIVDFGAACIDLGSDLQEVQNVVDVTFSSMNKQINEFAQNAASSFGLSETMAKKFTGTFGAMAKSFGFSENAAYDMATTLTGLAGDVASFYNLTQDEAYTKLKSVFTGETESLKDLGVVMTQTALDSYALANGFGKTTAKMTEAEKVALRYKFVQEQLAGAAGDFQRTSDGWANQVRVLKLQFDSFKATIGQGLINVLTPVIKLINTLLGKLMTLANAFKAFTEMLVGKKDTAATQMQDIADAADGAATSTEAVGKAVEDAAKKMKGLYGFDELQVIDNGSKDSGSADLGGGSAVSFDFGTVDVSVIEETDAKCQNLSEKIMTLVNFFKQNFGAYFSKAIGKIDFSSIKTKFKNIINELPGLARTSVENTKKVVDPMLGWFGNTFGNLVSVYSKTVDTALGGVSLFLKKNSGKINEWSQSISEKVRATFTELTSASEGLFDATLLAMEEASPALEEGINELLSGFTNLAFSVGNIVADAFSIASTRISQWVTDNSGLIQETIAEFLTFSGEMGTLVGKIIDDIGTSLSVWWEESGKVIFDNIAQAWNDIVDIVLNIWNNVIMPVFNTLKDELGILWENHLKSLWENVLNFIRSVGEFITTLWHQVIKPVVDWLVDVLGPIVKQVADVVIKIVRTIFGVISDVVGGIIKVCGGILDFFTGIFAGDWDKIWNGIKDVFGGIWDGIVGIAKGAINLLISGINLLISGIYGALRSVVNGIGDIAGSIGSLFGQDWHFSIPEEPPQISMLAQGGYVKRNTPQLAMIGDNKRYGEIVAPEDKMYQITFQAMTDAMRQFLQLLQMNQTQQGGGDINLVINGELAPLFRFFKMELEKEGVRIGKNFEVVVQ